MPPLTRADATSTHRSGHVRKKSPPVPRKRGPSNAGDQANKRQKQKHQDDPEELPTDDEDDDDDDDYEESKEPKATTKPGGGKEEGGKKEAAKKKPATKRVKKPRYASPPSLSNVTDTQPIFFTGKQLL
jgi:hypothetical protein